ncbi:MAG: hypothetical protein ACI8WB_005936 [Phenylobacterium sp.]|jgi:hypothetical protein
MRLFTLTLIVAVSNNAFADSDAIATTFLEHVNGSNKITTYGEVKGTSTVGVDNMKLSLGYTLNCPGYPNDIYSFTKETIKSVPWYDSIKNHSLAVTNLQDGAAYADGYPMFDAWTAVNTTKTNVNCRIDIKGIGGFSDSIIGGGISGFGFGISVNYAGTVQTVTHISSYVVAMTPIIGQHGPGHCVYACDDEGSTPLVIDLGQDGIHFGAAGVGVYFDINADAQQNYLQWVAIDGNEAFVVRDLNGNGIVDDGSELFGIGTDMVQQTRPLKNGGLTPIDNPSSNDSNKALNGFIALAQHDLPALGGTNDGFIAADDAIWPELALWLDLNADGISSSDEMLSLQSYGITHLDITPKENNRTDAAGNWIPLWSWATNRDKKQQNKYKMVDVYFKNL